MKHIKTELRKNSPYHIKANLATVAETETLVGTHQIGMDPMSGAIVAMEFLDQEYVGTTGELTIVKNGDVYTITANGTSMLGDFKADIPFSCSYEGKLFEMK